MYKGAVFAIAKVCEVFFLFFFNKEKVITWCLIIVLRLRLIIITYGLLGKWFEKNE